MLSYYHSEEEYKLHDALGSIFLKNISQVFIPSENEENGFAFVIRAGVWQKKEKVNTNRDFNFFGLNEEERDEWMTLIELARTVSIQKSFHTNYSGIALPISRKDELKKIFVNKFSLRPQSTKYEEFTKPSHRVISKKFTTRIIRIDVTLIRNQKLN